MRATFLSPYILRPQKLTLASPQQHFMSFNNTDYPEWKRAPQNFDSESSSKRRLRADFESKCHITKTFLEPAEDFNEPHPLFDLRFRSPL